MVQGHRPAGTLNSLRSKQTHTHAHVVLLQQASSSLQNLQLKAFNIDFHNLQLFNSS
jgi:hypothetical protein